MSRRRRPLRPAPRNGDEYFVGGSPQANRSVAAGYQGRELAFRPASSRLNGVNKQMMNKENKADRCPVCGGGKKPSPKKSTSRVVIANALIHKTPELIADSDAAESSNDQTANDFAAVLPES